MENERCPKFLVSVRRMHTRKGNNDKNTNNNKLHSKRLKTFSVSMVKVATQITKIIQSLHQDLPFRLSQGK